MFSLRTKNKRVNIFTNVKYHMLDDDLKYEFDAKSQDI